MDKTEPNKNLKRVLNTERTATTDTTTNNNNNVSTNDLLETQSRFLTSLPNDVRNNFFSERHVDPEKRAEIWERQATVGEDLVNRFSWATPDARALRIIEHFGPVIEIGCGANAYWARRMCGYGIDCVAFDSHLDDGGKIGGGSGNGDGDGDGDDAAPDSKESNKRRKCNLKEGGEDTRIVGGGFIVREGGPQILASDEWAKDDNDRHRTLFLCYPDEALPSPDETNGDSPPQSMATECLEHFQGDTIIHVGELFGDTLTMDCAPWGRSSSPDFQESLARDYHCILRVAIPNWLHARDTISVWKRTQRCSIVFKGDGDGDSDCEEEYRYVPPDEMLPSDVAAPLVKHLLS